MIFRALLTAALLSSAVAAPAAVRPSVPAVTPAAGESLVQRQGASGAAEENEMFGFLGLSPLLIAAVVAVIAAIVVVVATDDQASPA